MIDKIYPPEDSAEVRKVYYDALRKAGNVPPHRMIITEKEWKQYKKAGADMSKFMTLQGFRKNERERQAAQYKAKLKKD